MTAHSDTLGLGWGGGVQEGGGGGWSLIGRPSVTLQSHVRGLNSRWEASNDSLMTGSSGTLGFSRSPKRLKRRRGS